MYVLVDRKQMAITHKHRDRAVVSDLSWIECTNDAILVPLGNSRHFSEFGVNELKKIYFNATGVDLKGYSAQTLANVVHDMAKRLPEFHANPVETRAQRDKIYDGDRSCYQYQPGMLIAKEHPGTFEPDPMRCSPDEGEEKRAASTAAPYSGALGGATAHDHPGANGNVPTHPQTAPRAGGVKEIIFQVADVMWEQLNKTNDVKKILEMRKQAMNVLEAEHGIKKTTSSNALGDWQKARLS